MIFETHDYNLRGVLIHPDQIVRVKEAGPNMHGIGCYIRLTSGETIECGESMSSISKKIAALREVSA